MTLFQAPLNQPEPIRVLLSTTATTEIIPSATTKQALGKVRVTNVTGTAATVNLDVFDGTTAFSLTGAQSIPANSSIEIYDELLQAGHSLRATAGTALALVVHAIYALSAQR